MCIRDSFDGDEFALVLPDTTAEGAVQVIQDLIAAVREMSVSDGAAAHEQITLSVGLYTHTPTATTEAHHYFEGADAALRRAKAAGRDGYAMDGGA